MKLDEKFERKFWCEKWPILRKNDQFHTDQLLFHADQLLEMRKIVKNGPKWAKKGPKRAFFVSHRSTFGNLRFKS